MRIITSSHFQIIKIKKRNTSFFSLFGEDITYEAYVFFFLCCTKEFIIVINDLINCEITAIFTQKS